MSLHILSPAVDIDEELDDWYNSSDTSEDIPDPNMSNASLYQDIGCLAIPLDAEHFEEGLLYTMTLKAAPQQQMLVWIIEKYESSFSYQVFLNSFPVPKLGTRLARIILQITTMFGGSHQDVSLFVLEIQKELK